MNISPKLLKKLRQETGAPVMECKKALDAAGGDYQKARQILKRRGLETAAKKQGRQVLAGVIETYSHQDGKIVAVVELLCETDFVSRNQEFKNLAHEIAMQVAAMAPVDVSELLHQEYIRDPNQTMENLINEAIAKFGENIKVARFVRLELGR